MNDALTIHPSAPAELPAGWRLTSTERLGWASFVPASDRVVFLDGITWVALCSTGTTTMSGNPITREHFEALAYLQSLTSMVGAEGGVAQYPGSAVDNETEQGPVGCHGAPPARASIDESEAST